MSGPDRSGFGTLLRRYRLSAGLTQEALAERAGISAKAVSELERNPNRLPRLDTIALVAGALGLDGQERARLLGAARPADPDDGSPTLPLADMPRPLTPLVGREGVVDAVADELRRAEIPILTLTGPGGVGKTRVAIASAGLAADAFADGVVFVDLAPVAEPDLVLDTIARGLNVDERQQGAVVERIAAALRQRRLLLVLDNLEHLLPARESLLELVQRCAGVMVLVTSRIPLRVRGERQYRIAPLELPPEDSPAGSAAVRLFLDRARASGYDGTPSDDDLRAIGEICRRLDGLPLAIELAAGWARVLSPAALLARLDQRLPMLVDGPHDLPARQRTMRDAIAWSYNLLSPAEQHLFRCLAVFVGGCDLAAAHAVCGGQGREPGLLTTLATLVDRSLLAWSNVTEPRAGMLETIREFGIEALAVHGELDARRGEHARFFLTQVTASADGEQLEREVGNLRAALSWAVGSGDVAIAIGLAAALWPFWSARGYLHEGRHWLAQALELAADDETADPATVVEAITGAAILASDVGDLDDAERQVAVAVSLAREHNLSVPLVPALDTQGRVARERGAYGAAVDRYGEALSLARELGDRRGEGSALAGLGYARSFMGDLPAGIALFEEALGVFRQLGSERDLAATVIGLMAALSQIGDLDRVETLGVEALGLFRQLGETGKIADTLWIMGLAAQMRGQLDRAATMHEENLALRRARGDEVGSAEPLSALAAIALVQGDEARARVLLGETLAILDRNESPWLRSLCLLYMGHVELTGGDLQAAFDSLAEGVAVMQSLGNPLYLPWALEGLAGIAGAAGAWRLAARVYGAHDSLRETLGVKIPLAHPSAFERMRARVQSEIGAGAFATASRDGASLSVDAAVATVRALLSHEKPG